GWFVALKLRPAPWSGGAAVDRVNKSLPVGKGVKSHERLPADSHSAQTVLVRAQAPGQDRSGPALPPPPAALDRTSRQGPQDRASARPDRAHRGPRPSRRCRLLPRRALPLRDRQGVLLGP